MKCDATRFNEGLDKFCEKTTEEVIKKIVEIIK